MLEWDRYHTIALLYRHRVQPQDRDDLLQDIIEEMARAALRWDGQGMPDAYLKAIARHKVAEDPVELGDTLPGKDNDLDAWLDARDRLEACPPGVKRIARKLEKGDPLTPGEKAYLHHFREDPNPRAKVSGQQKRYWQRRASGLCVLCGDKADDGFARCLRCRERARAQQALYQRRKGKRWYARLREHWRKEGRCPRCGTPPEPGRRKCPQCLAKDREHLRCWREAARGLGAPKR